MGVFGTLFGTNDSKDYIEAEGGMAVFNDIWTAGESTNVKYANGEYRDAYSNYRESQTNLDSLFSGATKEEAAAARQSVIEEVNDEVDGMVKDFTKQANHNARTNTFDATMTVALPGVSKVLSKATKSANKGLSKLAIKMLDKTDDVNSFTFKVASAINEGGKFSKGLDKIADFMGEANYLGRPVKKTLANGKELIKYEKDFTTYLTYGVGALNGAHGFAEWSRQKGISDQQLSEMRTAVAGMNAACAEYSKYSNDIEKVDGEITESKLFKAALGVEMNDELAEIANNETLTEEERREKELAVYQEYTDYYKEITQAEADTAYIDASAKAAGANQETFDNSFELNKAGQEVKDRNGSDMRAISENIAKANGTASSPFMAFFKTINATIIRFCPFVATLEATAVKFVDSTYDWARDTITGKDQVSKYQNATITQIAEGIKQDSMEHLMAKAEYNDAMDNLTHSVSEQDTVNTPNSDSEILASNTDSKGSEEPTVDQAMPQITG